MTKAINVVLVDDHSLLRSGLAGLVTNLGYNVIHECGNGKQLIDWIEKNDEPDIILMDVNMPEMDGLEATIWLKKITRLFLCWP